MQTAYYTNEGEALQISVLCEKNKTKAICQFTYFLQGFKRLQGQQLHNVCGFFFGKQKKIFYFFNFQYVLSLRVIGLLLVKTTSCVFSGVVFYILRHLIAIDFFKW